MLTIPKNITPKTPKREPIALSAFAFINGLSLNLVRKYCAEGRILGARKHVTTKQWWIYPPAKIVPSLKRW